MLQQLQPESEPTTKETLDLSNIKSIQVSNWDISTPKAYLGYDINSSISAKMVKPSNQEPPPTHTPLGNDKHQSRSGAVERSETYTPISIYKQLDNKKPWIIELGYKDKVFGTLRERILSKDKVLVPKQAVKPGDNLAVLKLVQEARDKDLTGIYLNGQVYRYTANNHLYRLFYGTVNKDANLLPHLHHTNIYGRLHRNPTATLIVNFEHYSVNPNADANYIEDDKLPTMEQIYSGEY
jgi:hypothetical protein